MDNEADSNPEWHLRRGKKKTKIRRKIEGKKETEKIERTIKRKIDRMKEIEIRRKR